MKKFLTGLATAGMLLGALGASHALTQFAVLNPIPSPPGPQTPYFFDNASGMFGVTPSPLDVTFRFLQAVPVIGLSEVEATLTISAMAAAPLTPAPPTQALKGLVFEVKAKNAADFSPFGTGTGVLLRTVVPDAMLFPDGTLANLSNPVAALAFLGSEFDIGLLMESDYLIIDPDENQTATWSYSLIDPSPFAEAGADDWLQDTEFGGNANFSATVTGYVPEPGSVAMLFGLGVGASLALIRRRRTR
jgi:hypothetical protein